MAAAGFGFDGMPCSSYEGYFDTEEWLEYMKRLEESKIVILFALASGQKVGIVTQERKGWRKFSNINEIGNRTPQHNHQTRDKTVDRRRKKKRRSSPTMSKQPVHHTSNSHSGKKQAIKKKYGFIPTNFSTIEEVITALILAGLESTNLILGIDFTKSNEWKGKVSFNNQSLHAIGSKPNPYEKAISIIGKTLYPFDEDNLIPCFGFGDVTTRDQEVFSFHSSPCHGFKEVLTSYRKIVPKLQLSGPTSYGPIIDAAIDIVEQSGGKHHVLVIIADGQVSRGHTKQGELSPQEQKTIKAIVRASSYALSIVLVGVGDGPWKEMKKFDDKIPARAFDNFQFVNFTSIMAKDSTPSKKRAAFALAALMEIPIQYEAMDELGLLGRSTGKAKKVVPRPPPVPCTRRAMPSREPSCHSAPAVVEHSQECPICLTNQKDLAFNCGHMTCRECGAKVSNCPICRVRISRRLRLYNG